MTDDDPVDERVDVPEPFLRASARRRLHLGFAGLVLTLCLMAVPGVLYALNIWLVAVFMVFAWIAGRAAWFLGRNPE